MGIRVVDDRGVTLELGAPPERIVSLVPSDSYSLASLGAGPRLVGRTRFCVEPAAPLAATPVVGGVRDPDLAAIASLAPALVVASLEDNRREDVAALEALGLAVLVAHPRTVEQGLEHARRLALLLGDSTPERGVTLARAARLLARAQCVADGMAADDAVREGGPVEPAVAAVPAPVARRGCRAQGDAPRRLLVVVWPEPLIVLGLHTHGADAVRLAGAGIVAPAREEPYPRIGDDELRALAPDALLLPDEPYRFSVADGGRLGARVAAAGCDSPRLLFCDGRDLFWYGLRAIEGLARLRAVLHGGAHEGGLGTAP